MRNFSRFSAPVPEAILHIGMHKTGSTSIQWSFVNASPIEGFHYVKVLGLENQSEPFTAIFNPEHRAYHLFEKRGWSDKQISTYSKKCRKALVKELRKSKDRKILISGEDISGLPVKSVQDLSEFLKKYTSRTQVAAYVRNPESFLNSLFQELVKAGKITKFEPLRRGPRYRERFEKFDMAFGKDNVVLKLFTPNRFENHCVVTDFCAQWEIPIDPKEIVSKNESLSREAIGILYCYNKFKRGGEKSLAMEQAHYHIILALQKIKGRKLQFSSEIIRKYTEIFSEDIQWMERRMGEKISFLPEASKDEVIEGAITCENDLFEINSEVLEHFLSEVEILSGQAIRSGFPSQLATEPESISILVDSCIKKIGQTGK